MIRPVNVRGCRGRKEQPAVEAVPGERLIVANRVAARQGTFGTILGTEPRHCVDRRPSAGQRLSVRGVPA